MPTFNRILAMLCVGFLFGLATSFAAPSYRVVLPSPVTADGMMLKAGVYSLSLDGKDAVFRRGNEVIRIPTDIEKSSSKFSDTILEMNGSVLTAIDVGGTDTIFTFRKTN